MEIEEIHQRKSYDTATNDQVVNSAISPDDTITNNPYFDETNPKEKGKQALYRRFQVEDSKGYDSDRNIYEDDDNMPFVKVSNKYTLASIICVVAGSGILGIPHALSRSGWVGLLFLVLSSIMAQFCGCLLIRCLYHGQSRRLSGFSEIGRATFGKVGQIVGAVFSQFLLISTPTLYVILAGDNASRLFSAAGVYVDRKACTWIVSAIVGIPFVFVRTMRDVSVTSFFASMATVCLVLVMTMVAVSDFQNKTIQHTHHDWIIAENIPIAFSTFSFAYSGNVIFPHLESSMAEPSSWSKVLLVATFSVTMIYVLMGTLCYLSYGDHVETPVFNSIPEGSLAQIVAMGVATIHVLLAVPMYLYVFTVNIESWLGIQRRRQRKLYNYNNKDKHEEGSPSAEEDSVTVTINNNSNKKESLWKFLLKHPCSARIVLRTATFCCCALIAMLIPYFSDVMSLIGTIAAESLTFVLPCVFWIKISWQEGGQTWELIICALIIIAGIFCAVFGTYDAVKEFLHHIRQS
ncbi:transmembrane amino acid transporter protein-domain-containing protein [Circinella umbellata]|nr:transmembrane amino acid transporter protein-domain-containing protein [Circinella umbellata]